MSNCPNSSQPPLSTDDLLAEIRRAFHGVTLGTGIGLWEAQAIDDYQDEAVQNVARARDEKHDWTAISNDDLAHCESSLCFFNPDGTRFHLPAFLNAEIMGRSLIGSIVFHLTNETTYVRGMFTSLSSNQRRCVVQFLRWCLPQERYGFEREAIEKALREDWRDPFGETSHG